jgi:hypothetical protein
MNIYAHVSPPVAVLIIYLREPDSGTRPHA